MVTCWEPGAHFRVQRTLQAILVMTCHVPDTDATQLLTVWADQVKTASHTATTKELAGSGEPVTQERMTSAI